MADDDYTLTPVAHNPFGDLEPVPGVPMPGEPTMQPYNPSWSERLGATVQDTLAELGASKTYAQEFGQKAQTVAGMLPGVGQLLSANQAYRDYGSGNYVGAAVNALGAAPLPGGLGKVAQEAEGLARGGGKVADAVLTPVDHNPFPQGPWDEGRISTTTPWAKGAPDPHADNLQTIGIDTARASTKTGAYEKNSNLIKSYPGIWVGEDATPDEAHEALINHAVSNLLALHDAVPPDIRSGSQLWYDGANKMANDWATEYGKPPEAIAGAMAALSPQMDWYKNVSLARRVMDTLHTQGNTSITPEMNDWATGYINKMKPGANRDATAAAFQSFQDKPLAQITDPWEKANWVRAYDEAHNDKSYPIVRPDGSYGPLMTKKNGEPASVGWGSMDAIGNAVSAFENPSMPNISQAMGGNHKVRNFYNNIIAPNSPARDVTVDTHAIAAGLLRPLSGAAKEVENGLGLSGSVDATTGSKGLYGAYAEAYRRAADARGIQPRQMQSITWEALRGLFTPAQKSNKALRSLVDQTWADHQAGRISQPEAQQKIFDGAGGINPPSWYTGATEAEEE